MDLQLFHNKIIVTLQLMMKYGVEIAIQMLTKMIQIINLLIFILSLVYQMSTKQIIHIRTHMTQINIGTESMYGVKIIVVVYMELVVLDQIFIM